MIRMLLMLLLFFAITQQVQANKCQAQGQLNKFYQCSYESVQSSFICQCSFDILDLCINPVFPCSKSYLKWIYDDSQNRSEYNLWQTSIANFWTSLLANSSISSNFSELTNNLDFANMNNTLRMRWTQAFYMFQAISPQISSLNGSALIELFGNSLKVIQSQITNESSSAILWQSAANAYSGLTGRNWTVSGLQELVSLRLQFQIPCHGCSQYYGFQQVINQTKQCSPCPEGCRICSQNSTSCSVCSVGFELDPKTKSCKTLCPKKTEYSACTQCSYLFLNSFQCKKCLPQYGLSYSSSLNTNICSECPKRCQSCSTNSTTCTSCIEGFSLNTELNKCMKSKKIECKYKIKTPYKEFIEKKMSISFIKALAAILKLDTHDITILRISEGSTIIEGIVSATQSEVSQVFQNLKTASIPGFQIQQSQFEFEGSKFECNPYSCFDSSNKATIAESVIFIVFISIAGVLIILIFIIFMIRITALKQQRQEGKKNRIQSTANLKAEELEQIDNR